MRRYLYIILAVLTGVFSVSACGAGDIGSPEYMAEKQQQQNVSSVAESEISAETVEPVWSKDFNGLVDCFEYRGYVNAATKTATLAEVIGAQQGYRYKTKLGKNEFEIELYGFDSNNLSEKARDIFINIEENGYFNMLDVNLKAVVSDNFKYMMIYKNAAEDEQSLEHFDELSNVIKNFE